MATLGRAGVTRVTAEIWEIARVEWGVAEVGREIDPQDTPVEAALEDLVMEGKGAPFPGEFAVAARRRSGPLRRLVGVHINGETAPPAGVPIQVAGLDGERLRSVVNSPRVGVIGMISVPANATAVGTEIIIGTGEHRWQGTIARRPFVSRGVS
jgi:glycine cleavage system aminomethyltransferase T